MNKGNTYNKNQHVLLTCKNILYEGGGTLDRVLYPIGSIYMSVNSTNPSQLFGGTWTQITGRFLYCTTTSKTTGGSTTTGSTTLTTNQIPAHNHYFRSDKKGMVNITSGWVTNFDLVTINGQGTGGYRLQFADTTQNTGGGQGHTHSQNLPPYFTVYCWYRVS